MDWESRSACSSSPEEEVPPDRMVKIEMEAAEALADLAQLAGRGTESGSGGKVAGRARKWVKAESPPSLPELNLIDSAPTRPDLAQDCNVLSLQQHEKPHTTIDHLKPGQCPQPFNKSQICTTDAVPLSCGKSRESILEAEKEAKRLHRVLANRESARRTIHRRQILWGALLEELTRKALELTEENEKLKKGMEIALREFQNLETTNKHLKAEIGKALEHETVKAAKRKVVGASELKHARTETPTSLLNFPLLLHSTPFAPCLWPTIFQSPTVSQPYQVLTTLPSVPASVTSQVSCKPDPPYKQTLPSISGPRNPVYMLPWPWAFTLSNQESHCESSHCHKSEQDRNGAASSLKTAASSGKCEPVWPASLKPEEAPGAIKKVLINDLNEIPVESHEDQRDLHAELCVEEAATKHKQASSTGVKIARHDSKLCYDPTERTNVVEFPFPADHISLTKKDHSGSVNCSSDKRIVGAAAAAEARRRRKVLKKLKATHGQQCWMHS